MVVFLLVWLNTLITSGAWISLNHSRCCLYAKTNNRITWYLFGHMGTNFGKIQIKYKLFPQEMWSKISANYFYFVETKDLAFHIQTYIRPCHEKKKINPRYQRAFHVCFVLKICLDVLKCVIIEWLNHAFAQEIPFSRRILNWLITKNSRCICMSIAMSVSASGTTHRGYRIIQLCT